jgi:hypothetical protein
MKQTIYAGFALIALTNLALYAGVAYNRSADEPQQLTLSERELSVPYSYANEENSGVALQLNWQTVNQLGQYQQYSNRQLQVDEQKLEELGFDPQHIKHNQGDMLGEQTREVFWVLEFNGESYGNFLSKQEEEYQQQLADAQSRDNKEQTIERIEQEFLFANQRASRLFVIDTGLDAEQLRKNYPLGQFIVLKGLVRPQWYESQDDLSDRFELILQELSVPQIMIPSNFAESLEGLRPSNYYSALKNNDEQIKFSAKLAWGKRFEPWVVDIKTL